MENNQETSEPTRTSSTCESGGPRRVRLVDNAPVPEEAAVGIRSKMDREQVSPTSTATVDITVTNQGDRREVNIVDDAHCHFFNRADGRSEPRGLWLYRTEDAPDDRAGECWTREVPPRSTIDYESYGCGNRVLEVDGSIETTYEVWDDHTVSEYMPPGTYRFNRNVQIWPETAEGESRGEPEHQFEWWLDLEVTQGE